MSRVPAREVAACFVLGTVFGTILTKAEVISWFRIQEMFRFQSFHLYGILGSAVLVAGTGVALIRRFQVRTLRGEPIVIPPKTLSRWGTRYWAGGVLFGAGWALTGACPGPLFALVGGGATIMAAAVAAAIAGTWVYGYFRPMLPH